MADVIISLGSNIGDRMANLKSATAMIGDLEGVRLIKESSIYETEPWGFEEQEAFLNMCISIETDLAPRELLKRLMEIENVLGRKREIRWGPRTIDIDILTYDDVAIDEEELVVPHPRMEERAFVLIPLNEISNGTLIKGKPIGYWIEKTSSQGIRLYLG